MKSIITINFQIIDMQRGIDFIGVGVGAMIFNTDGKVFMAKRGPKAKNESGKWDFPGGSVEFGETCSDALKREINEEFGIGIEILELIEVVDHILPQENQHWVSPSFIAIHTAGVPEIMEPEKCSEIRWADLKEIDITLLTNTSASNLRKYVEKYGLKPPSK